MAIEGRCASCRWWESYGDEPKREWVKLWAGERGVTPRPDLAGWGDCTRISTEDDDTSPLFVIESDADWRFRTRSDFGCVQYEANDADRSSS